MSKNPRSVVVATLPTSVENKFLEITLYYFTGRGYVVNVQPMTIAPTVGYDGSTIKSVTFECFTNKSTMVEPASRFSAMKLSALADSPEVKAAYAPLVEAICARDGLKVIS